ncbi:MAG: hypothetical protein Q8781_01670 [Candidatus Phytoplasma stylosanthis]|uniref:hypothetical protein n=1 Tax=Candidatus Phytoplasma stylosanthis TaxID=2798314 RepID=UPI00293A79C8|nr:hypothetical protein [Candidatus Phytoplasma stylosanthis]MDV3168051.1 hypothetical protein [Candidatus Phytoplasma stylosanthis]MDV3170993.1 hypothetical protein [Candidatus Phytoplasma stylosanthis]MDV3173719.1 hypothetical protein [Candidatus Phytoplasma stylosanthis]MDV3174309.1 hypothetical protein [Candidatus Phytoplasma stylosanthis]MDV3202493.1 hypothetical protein [Candidatus Phytoplasma stylosanthis]
MEQKENFLKTKKGKIIVGSLVSVLLAVIIGWMVWFFVFNNDDNFSKKILKDMEDKLKTEFQEGDIDTKDKVVEKHDALEKVFKDLKKRIEHHDKKAKEDKKIDESTKLNEIEKELKDLKELKDNIENKKTEAKTKANSIQTKIKSIITTVRNKTDIKAE